MKEKFSSIFIALMLFAGANRAAAQGTAITYQGQLQNNGSPANGTFNFEFSSYTAQTGGTQNGTTQTNLNVGVTNGLFAALIDFGPGIFTGATNWLQIGVETNTGGGFTTLTPRQELTPTPYAIFATTASNLTGTIFATQLSGPLPGASLSGNYGSAVTLSNPGDSFTGNGGGLTNLNASQLISFGNTGVGASNNFFAGPAGNSATTGYDNTAFGQSALVSNTFGTFNTAVGYAALQNNTGSGANTAFGAEALRANNSAGNNTAIGTGALHANTTGFNNTAVGSQALYINTNGNNNTAIGLSALDANLSGDANTASGLEALANNSSGSDNVADGVNALFYNTVGSNNTATGVAALYMNTTGSYNVADGESALGSDMNGSYNIALGYNAGNNVTGSYNIEIGNQGLATDSNIIRIGTAGTHSNTYIAGVINGNGAGLTNLAVSASQLADAANANLFIGQPGNSSVTTGSANAAFGAYAFVTDTTGSYNTACGEGSLYNNSTGMSNIALGYQAGLNITGSDNIDIGNPGISSDNNTIRIGNGQAETYLAGVINGNGGGLTNLSASELIGQFNGNFFVGPTGSSSATGEYNIALGVSALTHLTSGQANTACGGEALDADTTGSGNTAIGWQALQNNTNGINNTALGTQTLPANTSGDNNTAAGAGALGSNVGGGNNTGFGFEALGNITTTYGNIALGYQAGSSVTGSYNIDIGNTGVTNDNNTIRIGTPGTHTNAYIAGDVFISGNTNLPTDEALNLSGSERLNDNILYFRSNGDTNHGLGFFGTGTLNGNFAGTNVNGPVLWGNGGGALGTCTISGSQKVAVYWTTTSVTVNGTFNNDSDRNVKEHFSPVNPADILDKVAELPVSEWSYKLDHTTRHIGPMAQDFYSEFNIGTDERHIAPIDEGGVALAAIKGLNQKLEKETKAKDAQIQELKNQNESLAERLSKLEESLKLLVGQK